MDKYIVLYDGRDHHNYRRIEIDEVSDIIEDEEYITFLDEHGESHYKFYKGDIVKYFKKGN